MVRSVVQAPGPIHNVEPAGNGMVPRPALQAIENNVTRSPVLGKRTASHVSHESPSKRRSVADDAGIPVRAIDAPRRSLRAVRPSVRIGAPRSTCGLDCTAAALRNSADLKNIYQLADVAADCRNAKSATDAEASDPSPQGDLDAAAAAAYTLIRFKVDSQRLSNRRKSTGPVGPQRHRVVA